MANGILELEPTQITASDAAAFAQTPQGIMLNQQLAAQELQQQQAMGGGGPASQAAINPQIRQQGLTSANVRPGGMPGQVPGLLGEGDIAQLYGIMAQYADDPVDVGKSFVTAMQNQQKIARQNSPIEQYLRLYGNINPYDFEADSIERFHNHYVQTGEMKHSLLVRKNDMTTKEQQFLHDSIQTAQKAEASMGQMSMLASRFDEMARRGDFYAGSIAGGISEWVKRATANEDAVTQLRTEFEQLRISEVVQNLPPGVASDKDVALVLQGWPSGVSDPAYIASFLRGMQKLKAVEHAMAMHGTDFIARNRGQVGPGGTTQLSDWRENADWMINESLRRFGGIYNPGADISPEQAATMRYQQLYGSYGAPGATAGQPTPAQLQEQQQYPAIQDPTPQREGESRRDFMRRKYGLN